MFIRLIDDLWIIWLTSITIADFVTKGGHFWGWLMLVLLVLQLVMNMANTRKGY